MAMTFRRTYGLIVVGAGFVALSLELCYIPHGLLDGGMTGLAVVLARSAGIPPVVALGLLNLVCLYIGVRRLGMEFIRRAAIALVTLCLILLLLDPLPPLFWPPAAAVLGGSWLGSGLGLVLRNGAALDGADVLALVFEHTLGLPVVHFLFGANILVFTLVAWLYGPERAFLSIVAQAACQVVLILLLRAPAKTT
jgi:uncharacterized membrane-anchored protein YitT (DUF2179 family)